ncbi:uncharacterized protein LOC143546766 [Bidens hawaiensis]|uniref:uncharacterized protein LOC143546766 n=1 Tax=Bidens hawaiensis TaxID=980011 RepID=UPI00404A87E1
MDGDLATNITYACFGKLHLLFIYFSHDVTNKYANVLTLSGPYRVEDVDGDTALPGLTVKEYMIKTKNVGCLLFCGVLLRLSNKFGVTVMLEANAQERDTGIARINFLGYERNIAQACMATTGLVNRGYFNMRIYGYRGIMPTALLQINIDGGAGVGSYEETIPLDMADFFFGKDDRLIFSLEARTGAWILVKPFAFEKNAEGVYIRKATIIGTDHQMNLVMRTLERTSMGRAGA